MSTMKLSSQEKKDLDKFMKFFTLKSAQIIVQSRLGEKVNTKCDPDSSLTVWFNLAIRDLPDVLAEAKKAMYSCSNGGCRLPVCVEISLRTVEGDTMILETWCIAVTADHQPNMPVSYAIYNRMGILLKSLLSVTRITPAYRISRRQGPDSYVICYRIYLGEPQHHTLGDGYKQLRVGQLSTPVGALSLSVAYRTKLTISPQHSGNQRGANDSIMVKSDHFRPERDFSPKHFRNDDNNTTSTLSDTIKFGAFADSTSCCLRTTSKSDDTNATTMTTTTTPDLIVPEVPFTSLLTPKTAPSPPPPPPTDSSTTEDKNNGNTAPATTTANQPQPPPAPLGGANDSAAAADFIMVDLKTPFAGSNANTDLGVFYRECQAAPPLLGFQEEPTVAEQVGDLTKQLELFETSLQEYDNVITTLCKTDNNN